ncbi:MAG: right-handed parallel beta-helix repeat-containing protein [Spirochaetales bacterium]|nr:right-handed parallel beta-helix repeat-containing protein [Spirochaetales bacterium]
MRKYSLLPLLFIVLIFSSCTSTKSKTDFNIDVPEINVETRERESEVSPEEIKPEKNPVISRGEQNLPKGTINIQELIDQTPNGGVAFIPYGEYIIDEGLRIVGKSGIILRTDAGTRILLDDTNQDVLAISGSSDVRLENLYLRHLIPREDYACHGSVVSIGYSPNVVIINCELNGCGAIGVSSYESDGLIIRNCYIHSNSFNAFYFNRASNVKIHSSIIENNGNMMQSLYSSGLEMSDNIIRNNGGYWEEQIYEPGLISD